LRPETLRLETMKLRWQFGIIAGIVLMICGTYPQLKMWSVRGNDWQGAYAYNDIDEVAYAAYLNSLIDGRPRRNDPYTGRSDTPEQEQEESLFSIQFAAPYLVAIPARILGVSVNTAMWVSGGLAAFIAGLALFWLIGRMTDDSIYAMAGALIVVCGGSVFAGEGAMSEIFFEGFSYPYFPGLRRYVPAVPFAIFFILCGCVWQLLTSEDMRQRIIFTVLSSLCFAFTVFSYFYIWTTAAAWLGCLVLVLLIVRPEGWLKDFKALAALGAACVVSLIPYAYLLSKRSHTMDDVQLLVLTRDLDLWRVPSLVVYTVIVMLILAVLLKAVKIKERSAIFVLSLALTVIVVFNQQLITGRSLQPIHYQVFIGNYVAGLALVLMLGLLFKTFAENSFKRVGFSLLAVIAAIWGIVECHYTVRVLDEANLARDEGMPVARRLTELAANDVPSPNSQRAVTLAFSHIQADDLPTIAPQAVLWARHQHVFAGVTWQENKERYYQFLYYSDLDEDWLAEGMKEKGDFVSMIALFGWGRHSNRLSSESKPLTFGEIDEEARRYGEYRKNFSRTEASNPTLSYVVIPNDWQMELKNLDKWYERDNGEVHGKYILYKVKLRNNK
jgi:hypothetical protein